MTFFLLSIKYKEDNFPSVKPLYMYGLIVLGFVFFVNYTKLLFQNKINLKFLNQIPIYILLAILVLFFSYSLLADGRVFKDFLYFVYLS